MKENLVVSSSPHVHDKASSAKIMWMVVAALSPAALFSIYLFGFAALSVIVSTTLACAALEAVYQKASKRDVTIMDGSAVLTGLILALTLPPGLPIWICISGAVIAIIVAKGFFGGLGQNPFNPAMTGRVFLLIAFPGPLTRWPVPSTACDVDTITAATPLGILAEEGVKSIESFDIISLMTGTMNGSLGETSAVLLVLGGLFLLYKKIITWHIPVSFIATVFVFSGISSLINPDTYAGPLFHIMTGGVIIGAFFMATDYVTSPMYPLGKLVFGAGIGILTMVIRLWAGYPEGVSFAVLLMNAVVPILDTYLKPKKFGSVNIASDGGN